MKDVRLQAFLKSDNYKIIETEDKKYLIRWEEDITISVLPVGFSIILENNDKYYSYYAIRPLYNADYYPDCVKEEVDKIKMERIL